MDRPQTASKTLRATRLNFAEQFRRMLFRQYPGWEIAALSSAMDLQRSLSPIFPRAKLVRGNQQIAAIGCPDPAHESTMLTAALVWHQHVRENARSGTATSLSLFLPDHAGNLTAHRLRWLTGVSLNPRLYRYNEHGAAGEVDPQDLGNLQTAVGEWQAAAPVQPEFAALLTRLALIDGVACVPELSGSTSIRCRGLEFARIERNKLSFGIETKQEGGASHIQQVEALATQLSQIRRPLPSSGGAPAFLAYPERWLESCVRPNVSVIDASLLEQPVHGQVLTFAAMDRDLIDLLAISRDGRLAVLELKASEDIHLPMQALDYWMRIARHADAGELNHLFPEIPVSRKPPRLLLIAPAIYFHSANATILRYFSPDVEVERIGLNSDWHQALKVVMRLKGADRPISHGSFS